jgi:hypothetical protein
MRIKAEHRREVRSVLRGELRYRGEEPTEASADTIYRTLDDLTRKNPEGRVARFYFGASDAAMKTLVREMKKGVR